MTTNLDSSFESAEQNSNDCSAQFTTPNRPLNNKIYQTVTTLTPPRTTHDNTTATPLAERRKTQVSNYLVSQDFKTDFAIKLHHLRQREMNTNAPNTTTTTTTTSNHNTNSTLITTPSPIKHIHNNQEKTTITPIGRTNDLSMVTSSNLKTRFSIPFSDQNSLKEEAETEDYSSAGSNQKGILSCRSSVRTSEDPEEQNAKYEVIRKLADQLAEQIEENDHLLYELGVVRSNNARLKSIQMDKEDELTCLNKRIRDLESVVVTKNNDHHPSDSSIPSSKNSSNLPLDLTSENHSETDIQSLKSQLKRVRNSLCQIQRELNPSIDQSNHPTITNLPNHTNKLTTGFKSRQRHLNPVHSRRHSWSTSHVKSAGTADQQSNQNDYIHSFARSNCWFSPITGENDYDLFNKIHQLEVELFQCHEARIISGVTLQTLINSIDVDDDSRETGTENKRETEDILEKSTDEKGTTKKVFENDSSKTLDKDIVQVESKSNNTHLMNEKTSEFPSSTEERSQQNLTTSSSPLMSLASFGFSGWARKLSDTSSSSQEITSPKTSIDGDQMAKVPSRTLSISDHQQDTNPLSLPIIEEPASGFIKFGFRSLFNYTSSTTTTLTNNNNNSVTSDTLINNHKDTAHLSSLVNPSSSISPLSSPVLPYSPTSSDNRSNTLPLPLKTDHPNTSLPVII